MDSEWQAECASMLEAPDKDNLPEPSSKALDPVDSIAGRAGGRSIECIPQTCLEYSQRAQTKNNEIILNIPDPPDARIECPTSGQCTPTRSYSATSMVPKQPVHTQRYKVPQGKQLLSVSMCPLTMPSGMLYWIFWPPERENEKENMPLTKADAPEPPPTNSSHTLWPYRVPHQCGRLKSSTRSVSITHTRQNTYHAHAVPMWLPQPPLASTKQIIFIAGQPQRSADVESKTTKLGKCAQWSLIERRMLVGTTTQ
ncbi:hypothetical protein EDD17DRAFT_1559300 [Pisolithus thermaeus]|nr:hypothetical protein EDD17DRAFT_1559300 [Pisolithus thermaeus]